MFLATTPYTENFLKKQNISVMVRPGSNHDVNPIENVCNDPKDMLYKDTPENVMIGS
jgi:hypothetical protein